MASDSKKPKLAPARPTRSNSVPSDELHGSKSKMHEAIWARDFEAIKTLLDDGDTFCLGDGSNCFMLAALFNRRADPNPKAHWQFMKKMLEIEPRGAMAKDEVGTTLLTYFSDCPDKIRHLVSLGADVNAVDIIGESVLMSSYENPGHKAEGFAELLKLGADPNVQLTCSHRQNQTIFDYMIKKYYVYHILDKTCIDATGYCISLLAQPEYMQKINILQICPHPIFSFIDEFCKGKLQLGQSPFLASFQPLKFLPKSNLLREMSSSTHVSVHRRSEWEHFKQMWKIPDTILLDPLSYLYFNIGVVLSMEPVDYATIREITDFLVQAELYVSNKNVLPPGLAMMYSIIQGNHLWDASETCSAILLGQEDVPRMLEGGDRILEMMLHFISNFPPSEAKILVVKLIPTLPYQPFTFLNNLAEEFGFSKNKYSTGKHFAKCLFPMVEIKLNNSFTRYDIERLRNDIFSDIKVKLLEEMQHRHTEDVSTLLDICRWRVREVLYKHRKEGRDLNSCIQELGDRWLVPPLPICKYLTFKWEK